MATVISTGDRVKAEPSKEEKIVQFHPRIIVELKKTGDLWTLSVKPRSNEQ